MLSPVDPFHAMTPLGPAIVTHCYAETEDPEWVSWIKATGECFWWTNRHVRRAANVTNALPAVSAFSDVNAAAWKQIDRYIRAGWLPQGYDPADVSTWKTP